MASIEATINKKNQIVVTETFQKLDGFATTSHVFDHVYYAQRFLARKYPGYQLIVCGVALLPPEGNENEQ